MAVLLFSVHAPLKSQVWIEGRNLSYLKGQKQINIQFSYEGMKVKEVATLWNYDTRRSKAEEEFVKQESKKYENKGKARSGEEWANEWEINKNAKYEPEFRRLFARCLQNCPKPLFGSLNLSKSIPIFIFIKQAVLFMVKR